MSDERSPPTFDPVTSEPTDVPSGLGLCLCPLCMNGSDLFRRARRNNFVSWILILKSVFYSLGKLHPGRVYFSLKLDVFWFVHTHWYIFRGFEQCLRPTPDAQS